MKAFLIVIDKRDFRIFHDFKSSDKKYWDEGKKNTEIFKQMKKDHHVFFIKEGEITVHSCFQILKKEELKNNKNTLSFRNKSKSLRLYFKNKKFLEKIKEVKISNDYSKSTPGIYSIKINEVKIKGQNVKLLDLLKTEKKIGVQEKIDYHTYKVKRDKKKVRDLKMVYEHKCQICNYRIELENGECYSEVHHLRPVGKELGNDDFDNMIVVCPNHHKNFDWCILRLDLEGKKVINLGGKKISTLSIKNEHKLSESNLKYQFLRRVR
jgi:predicted restriction endonuclease